MDYCNTGLPKTGQVARKPLLHKRNIIKRLKFAKAHKDWIVDQWMKVLWADESKSEIFGSKRRQYVRGRSNERYHPKCIVPTMKQCRGTILIWGCFSGHGIRLEKD